MNKVLIICGPTASGKTELAVECAKLLNSEVISADSMNVYKGLDIGTAKPTGEETDGVKHYMLDVVSPFDTFSVGDYREAAKPVLEKILSSGKIPVICGGTGFYINSLIFEYSYGNGAVNIEVREKYKDIAEKYGNERVYEILKEKDSKSAEKIHCNDLKRVIRALEIYENGVKKSDIVDSSVPLYDYCAYSINMPREELYRRIDKRVDLMIENGLVGEVENLVKAGVDDKMQCMQGIGYKEIYAYLCGDCSLSEAIEKIKLNTHHYAKRQITFFKKLSGLKYLDNGNKRDLAKRIVNEL